eukprot:11180655-Alexandrium_andersonii.AAC.1
MEQLANPAAMQVDAVEVIAVGSNSSDSIPHGQPSPGSPIPSLPEIAAQYEIERRLADAAAIRQQLQEAERQAERARQELASARADRERAQTELREIRRERVREAEAQAFGHCPS